MSMLDKSRALAFGVLTALVGAMGAPEQNFDTDWSAVSPTRVTAGAGGDFDVFWFTVDGGGGTSSRGESVLSWTIGQPDANAVATTGGDYELTGGFWAGVCTCPADLNADCVVDAFDLAILLGDWGPCDEPCEPGDPTTTCASDLSGDCDVAAFDLAILLGSWGSCLE